MSLLSEVKCSRCDRRYSGMRTRCPFCGARRSKKGKHAPSEGGSKAKVIIGIILMLVLIAAVLMLVLTSISNKDGDNGENPDTQEPTYSDDEGVTSIDGNEPVVDNNTSNDIDVPDEPDTPDVPDNAPDTQDPNAGAFVTAKPTYLAVGYLGEGKEDFTISAGQEIQLEALIAPAGITETIEWAVEDESIAVVLQSGKLTALQAGTTTLTITCAGVTASCIVRVN